MAMIYCSQLTKHYSHTANALSSVTFKIETGEMVLLTGHSGAGKSTLLSLLGSLEHLSKGDIIINGRNINRMKKREIPVFRRQIGLIFQNPQLLLKRSVFDNVALPLVITGFRQHEINRRVRAALDKVSLLGYEKEKPENLSCGEQQRVGIARAIVHRPSIILADEPTGNLDPELSKEIIDLLEQFNQLGTTLLIASHNTHVIEHLSYRTLKLQTGQLIEDAKETIYV